MTNSEQETIFAVAGADGVYLSSGQRLALPTFQQLSYWLDAMTRRHIDTLWLHPSAGWRWLDADIDACDPWVVAGGAGELLGEPWWTATRRGVYGVRAIVQPLYDERAPWRDAPTAAGLRDALVAFGETVGVAWRRSPGATGLRLLRQLHSGPHATRLELDGPPPTPATEGTVADAAHLHWTRALTHAERPGYLLSVDVNAQYLAATNGLPLGVGMWQHHSALSHFALPEKPSQIAPGYYRVKLTEKPASGPRPPITVNDTTPWLAAPTVRLLREQGAGVRVLEAYTWGSTKRYLDPWYKTLAAARGRLVDQPIALGALKAMYTHTVGWLASTRWDRAEDRLYRPDWAQQIRAQAAANVRRTIARVGANFGVWPLAVGADCVYYVSDAPEPSAPWLTLMCGGGMTAGDGVRLSPAPGHFKVKDSGVPVAEIASLLRGERWNLTALQVELNRRAGRRQAAEVA